MLNYPLTCNPQDMLLTQQTNQMKHMFCGDVMARGLYLGYAKWYLREHGITVAMHPDDAEALKRGTVDFYVFSYYMTNCCGRNPDAEKTAANICSDLCPAAQKKKLLLGISAKQSGNGAFQFSFPRQFCFTAIAVVHKKGFGQAFPAQNAVKQP